MFDGEAAHKEAAFKKCQQEVEAKTVGVFQADQISTFDSAVSSWCACFVAILFVCCCFLVAGVFEEFYVYF